MAERLRTMNGRDLLLWLMRRRHRRQVTGRSMLPTLRPGDVVLVNFTAYNQVSPRPGEIVLAHHPRKAKEQIIKRVRDVLDDETYILIGDNKEESNDSREFGAVPRQLILGRISCRMPTEN